MPEATMIMYEEEYQQIKMILSKLRTDANAKMIFLIDKNGQQIASHGEIGN
jgi:C4-dicarboxylate-specific signal transduction histidine kinase